MWELQLQLLKQILVFFVSIASIIVRPLDEHSYHFLHITIIIATTTIITIAIIINQHHHLIITHQALIP